MSNAAVAPPRPAAAPVTASVVINPVNATAERLFIQLVAGTAVVNNNAASLPIDAKNLAKWCFDLSHAFHEVELSKRAKVEHTVANFDANLCDFDAWSTKPGT